MIGIWAHQAPKALDVHGWTQVPRQLYCKQRCFPETWQCNVSTSSGIWRPEFASSSGLKHIGCTNIPMINVYQLGSENTTRTTRSTYDFLQSCETNTQTTPSLIPQRCEVILDSEVSCTLYWGERWGYLRPSNGATFVMREWRPTNQFVAAYSWTLEPWGLCCSRLPNKLLHVLLLHKNLQEHWELSFKICMQRVS